MLLVSSGIRVHPKGLAGYGGMGDGWLFGREGVVRENIRNLCRGDCSQASRYSYAASGECGLAPLHITGNSIFIRAYIVQYFTAQSLTHSPEVVLRVIYEDCVSTLEYSQQLLPSRGNPNPRCHVTPGRRLGLSGRNEKRPDDRILYL